MVTLLEVARLRFAARRAGLTDITLQGSHVRFAPVVLPDSRVVRVQRLYPEDAAQAGGAYDARTGAEVRAPAEPSAGSRCVTRSCWRGARRSSVRYSPTRKFWTPSSGRDRLCLFGTAKRTAGGRPRRRRPSARARCSPLAPRCRRGPRRSSATSGSPCPRWTPRCPNWQTAAKPYGSAIQLTTAEAPTAVLSWLIRFAVMDQVAAATGISVTQAQSQAGLAASTPGRVGRRPEGAEAAPQAALRERRDPPADVPALGRYQAQETAYARQVNGGKLPTTQAESNTITAALTKAQCTAAKSLNIQVSPQFGRLTTRSTRWCPARTRCPGRPARRRPRPPRGSPRRADGPAEQPAGRPRAAHLAGLVRAARGGPRAGRARPGIR